MKISKDTVVTLAYQVTDADGNMVDEGRQPLIYLHGGYGSIFATIEDALTDKQVGEAIVVKLQPEEAFGEYDASLVEVEPRSLFPDNIEVGMQFERASEDGDDDTLFTITDIAEDKVVVDGNHPLAGMALVFSCTVSGVRAATREETQHGHVHGPGGHHHH
ncbi:MAG TPA: peptidylprolyl isomerase [Rhodocyclaceae bacterium]|nr:peptidylprolyl isomerase [Rhodocyclaceae bacterium]HNH35001.1 peptidylprolyl isomerase [Rhodocyclaceae bacterium]